MLELTASSVAVPVVGLLALSAFFSSSVTAIFSLSAEWLAARAATDDRRAVRLAALRDDPTDPS